METTHKKRKYFKQKKYNLNFQRPTAFYFSKNPTDMTF